MSRQVSWETAQLIQRLEFCVGSDMVEFLSEFIQLLKRRKLLNSCLHDLTSHDWMILYRAVLEVEAGL